MPDTLLHIDSSARKTGSVTRKLSSEIAEKLGGTVIRRDLAQALPQIDEAWLAANWTPADDRDTQQQDRLALSDQLIDELQAADTIVIGVPVYNFGIPAALKAWIDLIARAGVTFRYTENGPVGLLEGKRAILAFASGGTGIGSDIDFASGYLRHVMGFVGITDVETVAADQVMANGPSAVKAAEDQIKSLAA